jgi:hypothetical protein
MPVKGYPMPHLPGQVSDGVYRPSTDIVLTTVLPTILGCILLVAAMLFGVSSMFNAITDTIYIRYQKV